MGTTAHVVVVADNDGDADAFVEIAVARLDKLEARWSRFLPDSEVSRLNAADGAPVVVSPETLLLVERAVAGWYRTAGHFDPTVLSALVAAGYDRTFDDLPADAGVGVACASQPSPGCAGIVIDPIVRSVRLPQDVAFDAGGIGKGLAADLVAAQLCLAGARGVCVNIGGDLRVEGDGPLGEGWTVDLDHPLGATSPGRVHLRAGAIASTWRTKRSWGNADSRHHLIDPATGESAFTGLAGVSVLAAEAWWAEVLAKAAFLAGPADGAALIEQHGAVGLLLDDDGGAHRAGAMERFLT
jgi:thiamine biosynthesis lipoprotein